MRPLATFLVSSILVAGCGGSTTTSVGATSQGGGPTSTGGSGGTSASVGSGGTTVTGGGSGGSIGGAGDAGAGGSPGGGGGSGGNATDGCSKLGSPDLLTLVSDPQAEWNQRRPRLAQLKSGKVLLAVGLDATTAKGPVDSPFASVAFQPWGSWPSTLGPAAIGSSAGGKDFRVAHDNSGDALCALYRFDPVSPPPMSPTGLMLSFGSQPGGKLSQNPVDATQPAPPLFLTRGAMVNGDAGHLWGWSWELPLDSIHYAIRLGWTAPGGMTDGFACGTSPVFADAVPSEQGFLVAASSSAPFGMCGKGGSPGPDGVPNRLQISRFQGGAAVLGDQILAPTMIFGVAMAPRADGGAWVVWRTVAVGLQAARVDSSGKIVGTPFDLGPQDEAGNYAINSLGNALVFAQQQTLDPNAPIAITLYGDAGPLAAASFQPPGGPFLAAELSVLGSPNNDAVLVAWSDAPPTNTPYSVHVARMTCIP